MQASQLSHINVLLACMIIVSFLGAMALHECGHALMASWLGDHTPSAEGRQTLNPRAHIDAIGMMLCLILAFQPLGAVPLGLGWGKPVKPDPWRMRVGANAGVLLVACTGPLFNLIIGLGLGVLLRFAVPPELYVSLVNGPMVWLFRLGTVFAITNVALALFNIIPLYPLDGYQILYTLLPSRQAVQFARSAQYGPFIILIIFFLLPFMALFVPLLALLNPVPYIWDGANLLVFLASSHDLGGLYLFT